MRKTGNMVGNILNNIPAIKEQHDSGICFKNSRQGSEWEKSSKQMGHELKIAGLGDGHTGLCFMFPFCLVIFKVFHNKKRFKLCNESFPTIAF